MLVANINPEIVHCYTNDEMNGTAISELGYFAY